MFIRTFERPMGGEVAGMSTVAWIVVVWSALSGVALVLGWALSRSAAIGERQLELHDEALRRERRYAAGHGDRRR